MKHLILNLAIVVALTSLLAGCGTTSALKATNAEGPPALSHYDRVVVLDFDERGTMSSLDGTGQTFHYAQGVPGRQFADMIAAKLRENGAFQEVLREPTDGTGLVVTGSITRYADGDKIARTWYGLGAGATYFDAEVYVQDNDSSSNLGMLSADRNSWWLGGWPARNQTVESFMESTAEKIALELENAKGGPPPVETAAVN